MQNSTVHKIYSFCLLLGLCGLLAGSALAETTTLHLTDGQTMSGDLVTVNEKGIILRLADGKYSDSIAWGKLTQADLKELQANPKAAPFVEPFIELTAEDKAKRTEIDIKPVPRLERPATHSFIGGLFSSPIGIFLILVLYAANLYAGYEISVFRAQPAGLVCGVSAILPLFGPIIFLSMPNKVQKKEAEWAPPPEEYTEGGIAEAVAAEEAATAHAEATAQAAAIATPTLPPAKVFSRGQFTFNRRFFETQVPGFFAIVRPEADKDNVLSIKSTRGNYLAQRICRISANELHIQVQKDNVSQEIGIPFIEIQEVQLRHKDLN
ncbi:MAG: hypothetical protein JWQ71_455 [Pedosphaera sp.]|nr:hypothetical protein [Pedosphaera sp.]